MRRHTERYNVLVDCIYCMLIWRHASWCCGRLTCGDGRQFGRQMGYRRFWRMVKDYRRKFCVSCHRLLPAYWGTFWLIQQLQISP